MHRFTSSRVEIATGIFPCEWKNKIHVPKHQPVSDVRPRPRHHSIGKWIPTSAAARPFAATLPATGPGSHSPHRPPSSTGAVPKSPRPVKSHGWPHPVVPVIPAWTPPCARRWISRTELSGHCCESPASYLSFAWFHSKNVEYKQTLQTCASWNLDICSLLGFWDVSWTWKINKIK